jgi:hypothetical protein
LRSYNRRPILDLVAGLEVHLSQMGVEMADKVLEQIVAEMRGIVSQRYPHRGDLGSIRVLGRIPKKDCTAYDLCADFDNGTERFVAKVYRLDRCDGAAKTTAQIETANLQYVHSALLADELMRVPCLIGDFSERCAVVTAKICGLSLQPAIMKAALLPGSADRGDLALAAGRAGKWLRHFHKVTAGPHEQVDGDELMAKLVMLCENCRLQGLTQDSVGVILERAQDVFSRCGKTTFPASAILTNFTPLNIIVTDNDNDIVFSDFSKMKRRGNALEDVATFMAAVECLAKHPFCSRKMVSEIHESFSNAYGLAKLEAGMVHILKLKILLEMLAQPKIGRARAARKTVMWNNVMRRFIHQAIHRRLAPVIGIKAAAEEAPRKWMHLKPSDGHQNSFEKRTTSRVTR